MTQASAETNLPLVLYHANCADGFGAAFAAWKALGDEAEYRAVAYGDPAITVDEAAGRVIYILDFSFSKEQMDWLFAVAEKVVWLDHHKGVFDMWCGGIPEKGIYTHVDKTALIILDNTRSGALIAWNYFHPSEEAPMLIRHIDDYDRWQFKLSGTKEFQKALWSYAPWSFDQWNTLPYLLSELGLEDYYTEGEAILRAHEQNVQSVIASSKRECSLVFFESHEIDNPHEDGKTLSMSRQVVIAGLAANCPKHLASDVGHHLATECGTFGLCWFVDTHGAVECSIRSNGDFDVSAIAKKFGGGGHKNAAGFKLSSIEVLNKFFYPNRREL